MVDSIHSPVHPVSAPANAAIVTGIALSILVAVIIRVIIIVVVFILSIIPIHLPRTLLILAPRVPAAHQPPQHLLIAEARFSSRVYLLFHQTQLTAHTDVSLFNARRDGFNGALLSLGHGAVPFVLAVAAVVVEIAPGIAVTVARHVQPRIGQTRSAGKFTGTRVA
jgi:hypothetical protein